MQYFVGPVLDLLRVVARCGQLEEFLPRDKVVWFGTSNTD